MNARTRCIILVCVLLFVPRIAKTHEDSIWRWNGADFAFCFITDDGTKCNLGWAEVAQEMNFQFTIAINPGKLTSSRLTSEDVHELYEEGFEIANHGWSHGLAGLPLTCPKPPAGSLLGYTMCDGIDPVAAAVYLQAEIERDSVATFGNFPVEDVQTLAYPRHMHDRALIEELIAEGYQGARFGDSGSYSYFSYGDFTVPPRNGWTTGISLYRVPVAAYATTLFGDHSATPPVHFSQEEFVAAATPFLEQAKADGGIFAVYAHHFGDDDDTYGDINYGSSGMTMQDLEWLVDLVRGYNGRVMTFGQAVSFYRSRTQMVTLDGDYVWVPSPSSVPVSTEDNAITCAPNPFNFCTTIEFNQTREGPMDLDLFDQRGCLVRHLCSGFRTAGMHSQVWDGLDSAGHPVSSGVYFLHFQEPGGTRTASLTMLK